MRYAVAAFAAYFAIQPALAAPPLEVKGLALGTASQDDVRAKMHDVRCYSDDYCGITIYKHPTLESLRFGPGEPERYTFRFVDGKLAQVEIVIWSATVAPTIAALAEKYGPPQADRDEAIQNRMGAMFANRVTEWNLADGRLRVEQRFETVNTGRVLVESPSFAASQRERATDQARKAVGNL